ncbi:MAG: ASPIC/UnbV domain-containing protein [Planctomycetes bacterium]|nr:ASPIC/UnbV domain-containing protein [Planctomycetota bacterium]
MFRLLTEQRRDAYGAMVRLEAAGEVQWRAAVPAYSYCTSNDPRVHFGLGESTAVDEVTVQWPDGQTESFGPLPGGRLHELRQHTGRAAADIG